MIFGFNTDITAKETVYHVQTEVCEQQPRLQSQIFVRGICVGKRSSDLPEIVSDEQIQQLARTQHRLIVEAVRSGSMKLIDPAQKGLKVEFLGPRHLGHTKTILRFQVLLDGVASPLATVSAQWTIGSESGVLDSRMTDASGMVQMRLYAADATVELDLTVRLDDQETKRRFLIKPANAPATQVPTESAQPEIERW
jgi:hypothetical protein